MNALTRMSEKGQVVIPKDVRDRLRLLPGDRLEVVERPDGVLLRRERATSGESFEDIAARIRSIIDYSGPPVSIEDMNESIAEGWAEAAERSDAQRR